MNKELQSKIIQMALKLKRAKMEGIRGSSKSESREYAKAVKNKKKVSGLTPRKDQRDPDFKNLSIEEYEKKYPTWD